jgi:23S rRNA (uracil1939-C5)-methyltransferase
MAAAESVIVKIHSLSYGPYGVGRSDGQAVLTPLTAPGDEARIRIVQQHKSYAIGQMTDLLNASPLRQTPLCPYFGKCGGCPWQHVDYTAQLAAKEKSVDDALRRIGKLEGFELFPIVPSPAEYGYRSRLRLQVDGQKSAGLYRAFSHEIIEIDSCRITDSKADSNLGCLKEWINQLKTPVQQAEVVRGDDAEQIVFVAEAREGAFSTDDEQACSLFLSRHKEIRGLTLLGRGWRRSWGEGKITLYPEDGTKIAVDSETFTQANRAANRLLVQKLLDWTELHPTDRILELYSGAGNFTLPVARRSERVSAVERSPSAVQSGRENSRANGLENIRWICSPAPNAVRYLVKNGAKFSKIILNPPRSGAKGLEKDLSALEAERMFYISCDPATLARDLAGLNRFGYRVTRIQPFDLFPHTFHVETLAEIVRS